MKKITSIILTTLTTLIMTNTAYAQDVAKNYYVASKSYGTTPETEPQAYVKQLDKTDIKAFKKINWLDAGFQYRSRLEYRDNDYRRPIGVTDTPVLSRAKAYIAVKNAIDPFRATVEVQDSRIFNTKFAKTNNDVNKLDFIQAYGELYFKNGLGESRPVSIKAGRMAFEVLDRRLIARNEWRNTTNNFEGVRILLGEKNNDWSLDVFSLKPVVLETDTPDQSNNSQQLNGAIASIRRWSEVVTFQPFYFNLKQTKTSILTERNIQSPGLRAYGVIGNTGLDYDLIAIYQFGTDNTRKQKSFGSVAEIGYSLKHEWKPRFSVNYGYASGDKNPNDSTNQRFERFYGFARPWSGNDYFQWENIKALKTRVEISPTKKLKADAGYSFYWLASATDRWNRANLRDSNGKSGSFVGHELDWRVRYQATPHLQTILGYAHFQSGEFLQKAGRGGSSDFVYLELTWNLFK